MRLRRLSPNEQAASGDPRTLSAPVLADIASNGASTPHAPAAPRGPTEAERLEAAFAEARAAGVEAADKDVEAEVVQRVKAIQSRLDSEHVARLLALDVERQHLVASTRAIEQTLTAIAADADETATEIAYLAITRLLAAEDNGASAVRALCRELAELHGRAGAIVRASEADAAALADAGLELRIEIDRSLAAGEIALDSERGQFDTSLEQRLEAIKQAFLAGLARHRSAQ
jgi:flagellar biosynthesis/type III secretory pathway protein FliH